MPTIGVVGIPAANRITTSVDASEIQPTSFVT